jgi:poly(A)-specific ribonuclease
MKSHIKNYVIIQFGLAAFHFNETTNSYSADVFNVYLFPRLDVSFKFQSTSVQFLCRYNFDFNKVNVSYTVCMYLIFMGSI